MVSALSDLSLAKEAEDKKKKRRLQSKMTPESHVDGPLYDYLYKFNLSKDILIYHENCLKRPETLSGVFDPPIMIS